MQDAGFAVTQGRKFGISYLDALRKHKIYPSLPT